MLDKLKIIAFIVLLFNLQANAQRNNIKILGYVYNNNFEAHNRATGSASEGIIIPNHSFAFGYERSLGNRIIIGLTGYLTYPESNSYVMAVNPYDQYSNAFKLSGSGWGYDSKYFFSDLSDGAADGGYIAASYTRYSYSYESTLTPYSSFSSSSGYTTGSWKGNYSEDLIYSKLGFKLGVQRTTGFWMSDYFIGVDFNTLTNNLNKPRPTEMSLLHIPANLSIVFGMIYGINF